MKQNPPYRQKNQEFQNMQSQNYYNPVNKPPFYNSYKPVYKSAQPNFINYNNQNLPPSFNIFDYKIK